MHTSLCSLLHLDPFRFSPFQQSRLRRTRINPNQRPTWLRLSQRPRDRPLLSISRWLPAGLNPSGSKGEKGRGKKKKSPSKLRGAGQDPSFFKTCPGKARGCGVSAPGRAKAATGPFPACLELAGWSAAYSRFQRLLWRGFSSQAPVAAVWCFLARPPSPSAERAAARVGELRLGSARGGSRRTPPHFPCPRG